MQNEELTALNVQVPKSYKVSIDAIAAQEITSSAAVVRRAIRFFLDQASTKVDASCPVVCGIRVKPEVRVAK